MTTSTMAISPRHRTSAGLAGVALVLILAGCGSGADGTPTAGGPTTTSADAETTASTESLEDAGSSDDELAFSAEDNDGGAEDSGEDGESEDGDAALEPDHEDFEAAVFGDPTTIDNVWFPLTPGNRLVLDGFTVEDGETLDHRIEFIVTDLTKEIDGVETVVAWIEDHSDDELVEAELAFYAQDNDGNVWFFGEYPEEYEDGEFVDAPAWIPGADGARAGIKMYAQPDPAIPPYYQGWGPGVEWSDYGRIEAVGLETCVELDCFETLMVAESSLDEEDIFQLKHYAPGIGNVKVDFRGDDETQEQLEVIEYGPISEAELDEYRTLALAMEARAYEISPDVYGTTQPLS